MTKFRGKRNKHVEMAVEGENLSRLEHGDQVCYMAPCSAVVMSPVVMSRPRRKHHIQMVQARAAISRSKMVNRAGND